jgi:D-glycero-beta-D-manno-heptose 1-phosphate adenylyltransferase
MAASIMSSPPPFERKIVPPEDLDGRLRILDRPIVFTNGVFDVLHRGHVTYLAESRALGASLLLALNSDSSVTRLGKGPDRPVNPLQDRLAVVRRRHAAVPHP